MSGEDAQKDVAFDLVFGDAKHPTPQVRSRELSCHTRSLGAKTVPVTDRMPAAESCGCRLSFQCALFLTSFFASQKLEKRLNTPKHELTREELDAKLHAAEERAKVRIASAAGRRLWLESGSALRIYAALLFSCMLC